MLDLSNPPVVIDEPGIYAVQRHWRFPDSASGIDIIRITANNVTIDLHGFEISQPSGDPVTTVFAISGHTVTLRNGEIGGCCEGVRAVRSTGRATRLDHLDVYSHDAMQFQGSDAIIADSTIYSRDGVQVQDTSVVERNTIGCRYFCLTIRGAGNRAIDNLLRPFHEEGVGVFGNDNLVAGNIVDAKSTIDIKEAFNVTGSHNVLRSNHVLMNIDGDRPAVLFAVGGTANTLDGNIAGPSSDGGIAQVGIRFTADGNYYGGNRLAATVPFELGGTAQTDWGGNVGY